MSAKKTRQPDSHPLGDVMGDFAGNSVDLVLDRREGLAWLPRSAGRLDSEQFAVFKHLQAHAEESRALQDEVDQLAVQARELGISWSLIGFAMGFTGETARQRYGAT